MENNYFNSKQKGKRMDNAHESRLQGRRNRENFSGVRGGCRAQLIENIRGELALTSDCVGGDRMMRVHDYAAAHPDIACSAICEAAGINRSAYRNFLRSLEVGHTNNYEHRQELKEAISRIVNGMRLAPGSKRLCELLHEQGHQCGGRLVLELMHELGIENSPKRFDALLQSDDILAALQKAV